MKKPTPLAERWPCIFSTKIVHDAIDPWISTRWEQTLGGKPPFGDLRNQWRKQHCRTLNPYGSEDCPFDQTDCAMHFQEAVKKTMLARPKSPVGYFRTVARMDAAHKADEGLTRRIRRRYSPDGTNVPPPETAARSPRSGHAGNETEGLQKGRRVRSPEDGPQGIGELLGSLDIRPRPPQSDEREEGA